MLKKVDELGRIVVPKELREELNIDTLVSIEKKGNTLVLSSPDSIRTRKDILNVYRRLNDTSDYQKGYKDALAFVLQIEEK